MNNSEDINILPKKKYLFWGRKFKLVSGMSCTISKRIINLNKESTMTEIWFNLLLRTKINKFISDSVKFTLYSFNFNFISSDENNLFIEENRFIIFA